MLLRPSELTTCFGLLEARQPAGAAGLTSAEVGRRSKTMRLLTQYRGRRRRPSIQDLSTLAKSGSFKVTGDRVPWAELTDMFSRGRAGCGPPPGNEKSVPVRAKVIESALEPAG